MLGEIVHKLLDVAPGLVGIDIELPANLAGHDIGERRAAIRRLPYHGGDFVEREKSRVHGRHNHHFAADEAGGDRGTGAARPARTAPGRLDGAGGPAGQG